MFVKSGLKKKPIFHESFDTIFALSLGVFFLCPILYQICTKLQPNSGVKISVHFFESKNTDKALKMSNLSIHFTGKIEHVFFYHP